MKEMDSQKNSEVRHLLFDLDGTLIHSGSFLTHLDFIIEIIPLLKRHKGWRAGVRALKESFESIQSKSKDATIRERMILAIEKNLGLPKEDAEKEFFKTLTLVFPKLKTHFGKIPGAAAFLKWAKEESYSLTLTTNPVWPIDLVHMRMRWGGIDPDFFKSVTTSDRMHSAKPSRDYYEEILAQEGYEAQYCLLIGNERGMDLPATRVGIRVFLIRPEATDLRVIQRKDGVPIAYRGNYNHLKKLLLSLK